MTVNEVEARTGLDRGTVRYYEAEGLISPARKANGYRDYSEADVEKLLKVKLLRTLNFSVDDIRAMDESSADFPDRLRARVRSLEARQADIGDLKRVLGMMISDVAGYENLNSGLYLKSIEERPPELAPPAVPERAPARPQPVPGPWRRFLARSLDFWLLELMYRCAAVFIFHAPLRLRLPWALVQAAAATLGMLFLEPLCLKLLGTTPGKAILGIYVKSPEGGTLTYRAGLRRTWTALLWGAGLNIPLVSLICLFGCYRDARNGVEMVWERHGRVELSGQQLTRNVIFAVCSAAVLIASLRVYDLSKLPPNRGAVTPEELAENVNRYFLVSRDATEYPDLFDPGYRLRADGLWDGEGTPNVTGDFYPARVELTVEGGAVTALRWSQNVSADYYTGYFGRLEVYVSALTWSFVGSDRDLGLKDMNALMRRVKLDGFRGFEFTEGGWSVKCVTHMSDGAVCSSSGYTISFPDGKGGEFGLELTITRG